MECWQGQQHAVLVEAGAAAIFLLNSLYKTPAAGEDSSTGEQGETLSTEMLCLHPLACQRVKSGSESWQRRRRCRFTSPRYFFLIIILFPLVPAPESGL